jgi:hypothetical protein
MVLEGLLIVSILRIYRPVIAFNQKCCLPNHDFVIGAVGRTKKRANENSIIKLVRLACLLATAATNKPL